MSLVLTQIPLQHFECPDAHEDGHLNGTDASSLPSPQSSSKKRRKREEEEKGHMSRYETIEEVGQESGAQLESTLLVLSTNRLTAVLNVLRVNAFTITTLPETRTACATSVACSSAVAVRLLC